MFSHSSMLSLFFLSCLTLCLVTSGPPFHYPVLLPVYSKWKRHSDTKGHEKVGLAFHCNICFHTSAIWVWFKYTGLSTAWGWGSSITNTSKGRFDCFSAIFTASTTVSFSFYGIFRRDCHAYFKKYQAEYSKDVLSTSVYYTLWLSKL